MAPVVVGVFDMSAMCNVRDGVFESLGVRGLYTTYTRCSSNETVTRET